MAFNYGLLGALGVGGVVAATAIATPTVVSQISTLSSASTSAPAETISSQDAVRLAKQASFGPTKPLVDEIVAAGSADAWITAQFSLKTTTYSDLATRTVPFDYCDNLSGAAKSNCWSNYFTSIPLAMRFYASAVEKNDQLRQRTAFALSQILVTSDQVIHSTAGQAAYQQILLDNAFGNYRDILKSVTLHAYMGYYLDMANSSKVSPNENYARELMQLFSMGVFKLNMDGSLIKDATGAPIPAYTDADVKEVSRALTGWTGARLPNAPTANDWRYVDYTRPMVTIPFKYDPAAKSFLGASVPAGATQEASVDAVVDAVFNHPNTAPFVSRRLIQMLVKANPSPAYVGRVAARFANNGAGARGDMKVVLQTILNDGEARGGSKAGGGVGKVKEPVLLATSMGRLLNFKTDGYAFTVRDATMGQRVFRSPSVFNFYPPDYPLALSKGLVSPSGKLIDSNYALERHNTVYYWSMAVDGQRWEFAAQPRYPGATGTRVDWTYWDGLGVDGIVDRVDLLMLNGTMRAEQRVALVAALNTIKNTDPTLLTRKRVQTALYVVGASPQFQIDR